ncbi:MAG: hypothetical protein ABIP36_02805 [Acidimicrobiales bacterium]
MDLRVLVLTADPDLSSVVRTQAENLGCRCTVHATYDEAVGSIDWADAGIVDLAGDGLHHLGRLHAEAPDLRTLAIATDAPQEDVARAAGAHLVIVEPFAIAEVVEAIRALGPATGDQVIDLRAGGASATPEAGDTPWFATR